MGRQFRYCGETWFGEILGLSSGVGAVSPDGPIDLGMTWQLRFECLSNPAKGPFTARSATSDINKVTVKEMKEMLEMVVKGNGLMDGQ